MLERTKTKTTSEIWGGETQNLGRIRASVDPAYADRGETKRSKIKILMICEENQETNELQDIYFPFKDTVSNL